MGCSLSAWSSVLCISILIYVLVFSVHSEDYSLMYVHPLTEFSVQIEICCL